MEMFNAIKSILLLSNKETNIISTMKHNTSYKFYSIFLKKGYLQEYRDEIEIDSLPTDLEKLKQKLIEKYSSLEEFLKDENREKEIEEQLEDYIYHDVAFRITDKFKTRYRR